MRNAVNFGICYGLNSPFTYHHHAHIVRRVLGSFRQEWQEGTSEDERTEVAEPQISVRNISSDYKRVRTSQA